jgi:hypothetical protein
VLYRAEYGERGLWVRPVGMFAESVERNGVSVPRFVKIGSILSETIAPSLEANA